LAIAITSSPGQVLRGLTYLTLSDDTSWALFQPTSPAYFPVWPHLPSLFMWALDVIYELR